VKIQLSPPPSTSSRYHSEGTTVVCTAATSSKSIPLTSTTHPPAITRYIYIHTPAHTHTHTKPNRLYAVTPRGRPFSHTTGSYRLPTHRSRTRCRNASSLLNHAENPNTRCRGRNWNATAVAGAPLRDPETFCPGIGGNDGYTMIRRSIYCSRKSPTDPFF